MLRTVCPRCDRPLDRARTDHGALAFACPACGGRMVTMPVLRRERTSRTFLKALWGRALEGAAGDLRCPCCRRPMRAVAVPAGDGSLDLDACVRCHAVWFDGDEAPPPEAPATRSADAEARKKAAIAEVRWMSERERQRHGDAPDADWKIVPAVLGMPVKAEERPLERWPVVTFAVAALLVLVDLLASRAAVASWSFSPSSPGRHLGLTVVTSFLLQGGPLALLANLYFLIAFGGDVEDRLGPVRMLALLAGTHLAGLVLAALAGHPTAGASAGILGVLGCYAVSFPRASLAFFWWLPWRWSGRGAGWVRTPAWAMLGLYLVVSLLGSIAGIGGASDVSPLAQLGGLLTGAATGLVPRLRALGEYARPYDGT